MRKSKSNACIVAYVTLTLKNLAQTIQDQMWNECLFIIHQHYKSMNVYDYGLHKSDLAHEITNYMLVNVVLINVSQWFLIIMNLLGAWTDIVPEQRWAV